MTQLSKSIDKLSRASERNFINPFEYMTWPDTHDDTLWYFSPELTSLYHTNHFKALDETTQKQLSFFECVNFFSLNIHGEKSLIAELAHRLDHQDDPSVSRYLHHFVDEENKHMIYFAGFCERYAGKVYPEKKLEFPRQYASGEEDFLFYAKVFIFEEIVDSYNAHMAKDERLAGIARDINRIHHEEEARHLAFGRKILTYLFDKYRVGWGDTATAGVREYLGNFIESTWREYYNPAVYKDCGFEDTYQVYEDAWNHPDSKTHRKNISEKCLRFLTKLGAIDEGAMA